MVAENPLPSAQDLQRSAKTFRYAQIGRCVNSVAHDMNNYLGAIMAYAELVGLEDSLNEESSRMLQEILQAVRKSTSLISNLTDIARKMRPDIRVVDLVQLVENVVELRNYDVKVSGAHIEMDCPNDAGAMAVDLPELERAMISLLNNAIEALENADEKRIRLWLHDEGERVEFGVWNSGADIPEDLHDVIFQPFFTTKDDTHLGLGLFVAREIAALHGGDLSYEPGKGFVMRLPKQNQLASQSPYLSP